jgi:hypothetical protein
MSQSDPVSIRIPEALRAKIRYYRAMRLATPTLPEVTVSEVVIIALHQFFSGMETPAATAEACMNLIDQSFMALTKPTEAADVFDPALAADPEGPEPEPLPQYEHDDWRDTPATVKSRKSKK